MSEPLTFEYELRTIRTAALTLDYYLVPWDTRILGVPVAQVAAIRVLDPARASRDFAPFLEWCAEARVALCASRVPSERLTDSMFLEEHGFRFIELNYQPQLTGLQATSFGTDEIRILPAEHDDREPLKSLATEIFRHGRFHQDPRIGPALGDRRYGVWLDNAFDQPHQRVIKCLLEERLAGFFVVETPAPNQVHWSLNGLATGLHGRGLGKRVWRAMLEWHRSHGVDAVTTSISSHNVAAFNLYTALGFRFPSPALTLHWCPRGAIAGTAAS